MNLGPLVFANPWGLLALLSIPAILGIHFFRQRFQRTEISALFLWKRVTLEDSSGRKIERPPISRSLLLELLIALLLSFLIARPQIVQESEQRIMILDISGSTQAEHPDGKTSFEKIKQEAVDYINSSRSENVYTLLRTGSPVTRIGEPGLNPERAIRKIDSLSPVDTGYDPDEVIQTAMQMGAESSRTLFLTDQPPESFSGPLPPNFRWKSVGKSLPNIAWTGARRRTISDSGKERIFIQIKNFSPSSRSVQIECTSKKESLLKTTVRVEGMKNWHTTLEIQGHVEDPIRGTLTCREDSLSADNTIVLLPEKQTIVRTRINLPSEPERNIIEKALRVQEQVRILTDTASPADLVIGPSDKNQLPPPPTTYFGLTLQPLEQNQNGNQNQGKGYVQDPYLVEKAHPLLQDISLNGVIFGGVDTSLQPEQGVPLVSSGNVPLIYTSGSPFSDQFLTNFSLGDSNIHRSVAWPVLISNLIDLTRNRLPGLVRHNWRLDETIRINTFPRFPDSMETTRGWELVYPDGNRESLQKNSSVELNHLEERGTYQLVRTGEDSESIESNNEFYVNFIQPEESNLVPNQQADVESKNAPRVQKFKSYRERPLQLAVLFLILLGCVLNWILLSGEDS